MQVIEKDSPLYQDPCVVAVHDHGDRLEMEVGNGKRVFSEGFMESVVHRFTRLLYQMYKCSQTMQLQSLLDSVETSVDRK